VYSPIVASNIGIDNSVPKLEPRSPNSQSVFRLQKRLASGIQVETVVEYF